MLTAVMTAQMKSKLFFVKHDSCHEAEKHCGMIGPWLKSELLLPLLLMMLLLPLVVVLSATCLCYSHLATS